MHLKKLILFILTTFICLNLMACSEEEKPQSKELSKLSTKDMKVAFIYLGPLRDFGYAHAHEKARLKLTEELGVETLYVDNVDGDLNSGKVVEDLIKQGCNVIYATSFEHMEAIANAAEKHPHIYFGHATGYLQLKNLTNYMGKIYEARYLAGIIAGMNTKSNIIGYVASIPNPEVFSGINAFALGVKKVNENAKVEVEWTNSWDSLTSEANLTQELISKGADIITHHTDGNGTQITANESNILSIAYNISNTTKFPTTYITAPMFNWEVFYLNDVKAILDGTWQSRSYFEGLAKNMVHLDTINKNLVVEGTVEAVEKAKQAIIKQKLNIFTGPIYDDMGGLQVKPEHSMYDEEILSMTFLVDNVVDNMKNN